MKLAEIRAVETKFELSGAIRDFALLVTTQEPTTGEIAAFKSVILEKASELGLKPRNINSIYANALEEIRTGYFE